MALQQKVNAIHYAVVTLLRFVVAAIEILFMRLSTMVHEMISRFMNLMSSYMVSLKVILESFENENDTHHGKWLRVS